MNKLRKIKLASKRVIRRPFLGSVIFAILCAVITEMVARGSISSAMAWTITKPHRLVILGGLLLVFFRAIQAVTGSFRAAWAVGFAPILFLSLVHAAKFSARNEPLFPWDIMLFSQGKSVTTIDFFPLSAFQVIIISLLIIITVWLAWSMPKKRPALLKRLSGPATLTMIIISVFAARHMDSWRQLCIYSGFHFWDQNRTTERLGFLPSFVMNIPSAAVSPPRGYSDRQANEIITEIKTDENTPARLETGDPINLIIFVAEGFWDPAGFRKIKFDNDPVANFHDIIKNHASLELISPVLGGNTCNAEFEILTGLNMSFLPAGSIPFQQYIRHNVDSLAGTLSQNGYESVAIHPFHKWFWNRDKVYPLLGFDRFISMENMTHTQTSGEYISDMSLAEEIIQTAQSSEKPFFIYAVSMENHCPYPLKRYENEFQDAGLAQASRFLTNKQHAILTTYITGIHHADLAMGRLREHFSKSKRKTMIVFVGDHLAYLDAGYGIYKKCGYLDSDELFAKMFTQRAAVWTNYGTEKFSPDEPVSFSYLPGILLERLGVSLPPLQQYLARIRPEHPVIHQHQPATGLEIYKILQYDAIFGRQASSKTDLPAEFQADK